MKTDGWPIKTRENITRGKFYFLKNEDPREKNGGLKEEKMHRGKWENEEQ